MGTFGRRMALFAVPVLVLTAVLIPRNDPSGREPYRFTAALYRPGAGTVAGGASTITDPTDGPVARFARLGADGASFVHPGVFVSRDQLQFVRDQIAAGAEPWTTALAQLRASAPRFGTEANIPFTDAAYKPTPVDNVTCDQADSALTKASCNDETNDATAAYADTLLYSYTAGPERDTYAQRAIAILNGWSAVFRHRVWPKSNASLTAQASLQASWAAPLFVRAAEILRYTYTPAPGAAALDLTAFRAMLDAVYTSFVATPPANGGANWQMSFDEAAISIAVYTDDHAAFDSAVNRWQNDVPSTIFLGSDVNPYPQLQGLPLVAPGSTYDTSSVTAAAMTSHWRSPSAYPDGLEQETCRDASHMSMGLGSLTDVAETARLQGVDLYSTQASRLAAALELNARYLNGGASPAGWVCPAAPVASTRSGWPATFALAYDTLANRLGLALPNLSTLLTTVAQPSPYKVNHNMAFEALTSTSAPRGTGCPAPDPRLGTVTMTLTVPNDGTYRLWARTMPATSGSNLLYAAVDGGCAQVLGGARSQTAGRWAWVNSGADGTAPVGVALTAGPHTIVLSGLTPQLAVSRVLLTTDTGCVPAGLTDTCTDAIVPTAPTTVTATPTSARTVELSWSGAGAESAVDHYVVYRDGAQLATVTGSSFDDSGLAGGETHTYTVVTVDDFGMSSAPSLPATATTPPATLVVTVSADAGSGTIPLEVSISDPTDVDHVDYLVDDQVVASSATAPFAAGWDSTTVVNGPHRLQAVAYACGDPSPSAVVDLDVANPDTQAPSTPGGLAVTATSQDGATVTWRPATDDVGVTGYDVYRDGSLVGTTPSTAYPDSGLVVGRTYRWTVTAHDAAGNVSPAGDPATLTVADLTAPDAPPRVTADAGGPTTVTVRWAAADDNVGVVAYNVLRNGSVVASTPGTYVTDTVAAGTGYSYTVVAVDAAGNVSAPSSAATVTTPAPPDTTPPTAPTALGATNRTTSGLTLTWAAATDNVGIASYTVTRNGTTVATGLVATSFGDSGLADASSYAYTVTAYDAAGNASPAAKLTTSTLDGTAPSAPTAPAAYATAANAIRVTWTAATDNKGVTGYTITRNGTAVATVTGTSFSDTGLAAGTTYRYAVTARDAAGNVGVAAAVGTSTPLPVAAAGAGLTGQYFAGTSLGGVPVTRRDATVAFSWGSAAPIAGVPADGFSVRWTGTLTPKTTGAYKLYADTDDGVRVWVNDTLLIDRWSAGAKSVSAAISLTAGTGYALRVEYYDASGAASATLSWSGPGVTKAVVPSTVLASQTRGLAGTYYASDDLTGPPVLARPDPNVRFSWGGGSPDPRVPSDGFSARWTGRLRAPASATYTFTTDSDSGVRLWVNSQLIIDRWAPHSLATNTGTIALTAGTYYAVRVEYRETTGTATVNLYWAYGSTAKTIVPTTALVDR